MVAPGASLQLTHPIRLVHQASKLLRQIVANVAGPLYASLAPCGISYPRIYAGQRLLMITILRGARIIVTFGNYASTRYSRSGSEGRPVSARFVDATALRL